MSGAPQSRIGPQEQDTRIATKVQDTQLAQISNFIWNIADSVLRDLYVRGKYRDVILPMMVIRRLDAVLEPTKQAVQDEKKWLDQAGITDQAGPLQQAAGQQFYNSSPFTLRDLRNSTSQQQLRDNFNAYLDGFSPNVQDILEKFEFRNQIARLSNGNSLDALIERFLTPTVNFSPNPLLNDDGSVRLPGMDNHAMGTIFEDLLRRFNEENNEEAGEHWTPRDAVELMAKLVFLPIKDRIHPSTYVLYDGALGTGGMLTIAEQTLRDIAEERGDEISTHLYGQEINSETYAICKADLLLKGEGNADANIIGGPEYSTLSNDAFKGRTFDFMLSNPPYGKSWKTDQDRMGGRNGITDPRFVIQHARDPEYSLINKKQRRPTHVPGKHAQQDERGYPAWKQGSRGPQRELPVHRGRRPGREQHSPVDHRERLAGGHRRPTPQHVLQHRNRHLRLGPDQPETRAPERDTSSSSTQPSGTRPSERNMGQKNCELSPDEDTRQDLRRPS